MMFQDDWDDSLVAPKPTPLISRCWPLSIMTIHEGIFRRSKRCRLTLENAHAKQLCPAQCRRPRQDCMRRKLRPRISHQTNLSCRVLCHSKLVLLDVYQPCHASMVQLREPHVKSVESDQVPVPLTDNHAGTAYVPSSMYLPKAA